MNNEHDRAPVIFGEVLYDCFPDGNQVLGGAPFNVAWHLQAFGMSPLMVSRIGADERGSKVETAMQDWNMSTEGLQQDPDHPTGIVDIRFNDGEPDYTIVENSAWDFIDPEQLPERPASGILYHGSLALRNEVSRRALDALKADHDGLVFMDVNLRDPWWDSEEVIERAAEADWVKLNHDELAQFGDAGGDIAKQAESFLQKNALTGLIVTMGADGAMGLRSDGEKAQAVPEKALQVVDTVGAGDAFTSVLILGLMLGWPLALTMGRAQAFASRIVGRQGATVDEKSFYQPLIEEWSLDRGV